MRHDAAGVADHLKIPDYCLVSLSEHFPCQPPDSEPLLILENPILFPEMPASRLRTMTKRNGFRVCRDFDEIQGVTGAQTAPLGGGCLSNRVNIQYAADPKSTPAKAAGPAKWPVPPSGERGPIVPRFAV